MRLLKLKIEERLAAVFDFHQHLVVALAAMSFRAYRADYYQYLSEMMNPKLGKKTLLSVFEDDALRYFNKGARGVLSKHWLERYPQCSGDLYSTFLGSLPKDDLSAIRVAQLAGAATLTRVLSRLSNCIELTERSRKEFLQTVLVGLIAVLVALLSIMTIPFFSYERLLNAFASLPPAYYGEATRKFFSFAMFLQGGWFLLVCAIGIALALLKWSFVNYVGVGRQHLDNWGFWRLYRNMHAMRFLALLAVHLDPHSGHHIRLKYALNALQDTNNRWLEAHIQKMLDRLDRGWDSLSALDTGLLETQTWWYLSDLVNTLGIDCAIAQTADRLQRESIIHFKRDALLMRWGLLLCALFMLLTLAWWHFQVIEELRQGMALFFAS